MPDLFLLQALVILLLISLNALFAMVEIAVVTARQSQLQVQADQGERAAQVVLRLKDEPSQFLATIQVGITMIGILAGAIGSRTVAEHLASLIERVAFLSGYSDVIAISLVVIVISYFSLVLGELVPKQIALWDPERIATLFGPLIDRFATIFAPLVRWLSVSADVVVRIIGLRPSSTPVVTEEEVRQMVRKGTQSGLFEPIEEEVIRRTFRLSDLKVSALMTPRSEINWLDLNDPIDTLHSQMIANHHTRFPVATNTLEQIQGFVHAKDLLRQTFDDHPINLQNAIQPAHFIPESMDALDALEWFRETRTQVALIVDEYGEIEGLVTIDDFLDAIVGDLSEAQPDNVNEFVPRSDNSFLVDGIMPLHEVEDFFQLPEVSRGPDNSFDTLGGFVMNHLNCMPSEGAQFAWHGARFEVVDMDGQRVDKVLITMDADDSPPVHEQDKHEQDKHEQDKHEQDNADALL